MQKKLEQLPGIKIVGISVRTSNRSEMMPETAQIALTMKRFWEEGIPDRIAHRKNPGRVLAVYTDYETDEHGEYSYFFGEEVTSFEDMEEDLKALVLPQQAYVKFTSAPGMMPDVVIHMWRTIWNMTPEELGGTRAYVGDFEVYDRRSQDPQNAVLDLYIGITS